MRERTAALVASLILSLASVVTAQPVDDQFLIAPGVGVGSVRFGMSLEKVRDLLGKERSTRQMEPGHFEYLFPTKGSGRIRLTLDEKGIAFLGVWTDTRYRTAKGIGVGSTDVEVKAAYGNPTQVRRLPERVGAYYNNPKDPPYDNVIYRSQHLRFYIDRDPNSPMVNQVFAVETWREQL